MRRTREPPPGKRVFDVVVAGTALAVLTPLLLYLAQNWRKRPNSVSKRSARTIG